MIGRAIDINFHLITESGRPPPSDYYASFTQLAVLKILESDFAARMARAAGLRNRLVHEYNDIDQRKVFEALNPRSATSQSTCSESSITSPHNSNRRHNACSLAHPFVFASSFRF